MKSKKTDWKLPAIILLALLLILEMADIYRLARSGDTQPLPVLMYHHVVPDGQACNDMTVTAGRLEQDLRWLAENGYETVLPRELAAGEPLPEKAVRAFSGSGCWEFGTESVGRAGCAALDFAVLHQSVIVVHHQV